MTDRKEVTRRSIVAASRRLMTANGVRATTIEQIAREAYVSVGTVYTHFANKEALASYFVNAGMDALEVSMADARTRSRAIERVHAAGEAYLQFAEEHPIAARFASTRVLDPDPSPEFVEVNTACSKRMRPIVRDLARDVAAAMADGEIRPSPVEDTVAYLWALWKGAAVLVLRKDEFTVSHEQGRRVLELGAASLMYAGQDAAAPRGQLRS